MEFKKIEFTDELRTGISFVDHQHEQLIERINVFLDAIEAHDEEFIEDTVEYVLQYTLYHFKSEENVMIRHLYEEFETHRDQHSVFIKKMFEVKRQIENYGVTPEIIELLKNELLDWLMNHIIVQDKKLAAIGMKGNL
jgi:hemerythrin